MQLTIHTLLPRSLAESDMGDAIAQRAQESIRHIHLEDIAVNEGPWRGLHAADPARAAQPPGRVDLATQPVVAGTRPPPGLSGPPAC